MGFIRDRAEGQEDVKYEQTRPYDGSDTGVHVSPCLLFLAVVNGTLLFRHTMWIVKR